MITAANSEKKKNADNHDNKLDLCTGERSGGIRRADAVNPEYPGK